MQMLYQNVTYCYPKFRFTGHPVFSLVTLEEKPPLKEVGSPVLTNEEVGLP